MSQAKAQNRPLPKRFYAAAAVLQNADGFVITLDGKPVRTPQQQSLQTSSPELAYAIAAEWNAQQDSINTETMPLTRLLNITLDRIAIDRAALLKDMTGYGETDLLCYRAPETTLIPAPVGSDFKENKEPMDSNWRWNEGLAPLQAQHFDPVLACLKREYGMHFVLTDGLIPVPQPTASLQKLAQLFAASDDHELAALAFIVPILGSALLALALWKRLITVDEALIAARLDEAVQEAQWGAAPEAAAKWQAKCHDMKAADFYLRNH